MEYTKKPMEHRLLESVFRSVNLLRDRDCSGHGRMNAAVVRKCTCGAEGVGKRLPVTDRSAGKTSIISDDGMSNAVVVRPGYGRSGFDGQVRGRECQAAHRHAVAGAGRSGGRFI